MRVSPQTARRFHWVPNALTVGRLLALPLIIWMLAYDGGPTSAMAAWTFAAVAVTDFIDGRLARALDAVLPAQHLGNQRPELVVVIHQPDSHVRREGLIGAGSDRDFHVWLQGGLRACFS